MVDQMRNGPREKWGKIYLILYNANIRAIVVPTEKAEGNVKETSLST